MHTTRPRLCLVLACAAAAAMTQNLRAASYTVNYLHPAGMDISFGYGAANGQQAGYEAGTSTGSLPQAVIWAGNAGSVLNIQPAGFDDSIIWATNGTHQVGYGTNSTASQDHAILWTGTAASAIDLNPAGFTASYGFGVSSTQQVGTAYGPTTNNSAHAFLWTGTASGIDLHPTTGTYDTSTAQGVAGGQQVGYGDLAITPGVYHALLWTGSATSFVDLNPSGFVSSQAYGTSGTQQVGFGATAATGTNSHALLWASLATAYTDLNPSGYDGSVAEAIAAGKEVGWGFKAGSTDPTALLWTGTAGSAIDLGQYLSADYSSSEAWAIAPDGTIVGEAYNNTLGQTEAVMWTPVTVPEPGSVLFILGGAAACLARRRRGQLGVPSNSSSRSCVNCCVYKL